VYGKSKDPVAEELSDFVIVEDFDVFDDCHIWHRPVLILIPMMLGLSDINPEYYGILK